MNKKCTRADNPMSTDHALEFLAQQKDFIPFTAEGEDEFDEAIAVLQDCRAELERLTKENTELQAGIHGYIADVHSAKRAIEVVIHAQGEQFKLREVAEAKIESQAAEIERLRSALANLVRCNEEWNAAVEGIIGRPAGWNASYLKEAKDALASRAPEEETT